MPDRSTRELRALTEVAKTLTAPPELPELLEAVMDRIEEVLEPAEFGIVLLWDPLERVFRPRATFGQGLRDLQALYQISLREGEAITGKVFTEGRAHLLGTPDEVARAQADMQPANREKMLRALDSAPARSVLAAPLSAGERKFGVLVLGTLHGQAIFSERDVPFVQTLADLIALSIDRARLESEATVIQVAKQADRLQAEAMATLSHELRTPLAAIKGYATGLLLEEVSWPEEKQREFLRLIEDECDNLETMIGDILDSSLIEAGQLMVEHQPVRLERLARAVAEEMQQRTGIHRLVIDFPLSFPIVDADPLRVKQVIRNIVDNAIRYSPDGGLVVIRGQVRPADVVVSIADQGVDISPEDLIPLFDKYFRVKSPTGHYVPGTGLGLPVARAVVEAHGGRIWAESKVREGTTLYFSLPSQGLSTDMPFERSGAEGDSEQPRTLER